MQLTKYYQAVIRWLEQLSDITLCRSLRKVGDQRRMNNNLLTWCLEDILWIIVLSTCNFISFSNALYNSPIAMQLINHPQIFFMHSSFKLLFLIGSWLVLHHIYNWQSRISSCKCLRFIHNRLNYPTADEKCDICESIIKNFPVLKDDSTTGYVSMQQLPCKGC